MNISSFLGYMPMACALLGIIIMPIKLEIFRFFGGSFGLWIAGLIFATIALFIPGQAKKAGFGFLSIILSFIFCAIYIRYNVYSAH